ncbi:MAG: hypothetical protein HYY62_03890 [Deltaproteobacteria bacterium]|nr:hypothetical protein [Deltaproteobacteria bacterium]
MHKELLEKSKELKSGLGAIAFAIVEGLRRSGAEKEQINQILELLQKQFPKLKNDECNALCKVTEMRLQTDKIPGKEIWY